MDYRRRRVQLLELQPRLTHLKTPLKHPRPDLNADQLASYLNNILCNAPNPISKLYKTQAHLTILLQPQNRIKLPNGID